MAWYELTFRPDGETWLVTSPDFEEVVTFGSNKEEACRNARDAIEEAIAARIAEGLSIPAPMRDAAEKGYSVQMHMMVILKAGLYMVMKAKGMTRADLMRKLEWHREQVDRLFRLDHQTKLGSLEEAFEAVGEPLRIDIPFPQLKAA
ncbi:type II toxin-antitoxin system HicB family antitoxin [Brucella pituitosa]|uniref:Type II toxin-antitoxin system HicB family antitoxin n=1 Tax=Brucella pituitosa TaxID=571256 RepID=A0A643F4V4_9HYPH|nr:type II toxin-antitoxin system HicB family antitoxin [Brucella pituitosa]KAB0573367.1 type II toxin-antitoxin system HicB family antitoxin [Brucella pituitosa]